MDYNNLYTAFVVSRQRRNLDPEIKYEQHHIIPKCLDGVDHPSNLIWLTRREHMLAHWILYKIYPDDYRIYWPLQWFVDNMSPVFWRIFSKNRSRFYKLQDRSILRSEEYGAIFSDISVRKWELPEHRNLQIGLRSQDDYRKTQSIKMKQAYARGIRSTPNNKARAVNVEGKYFPSCNAAAIRFGVSNKTVTHRINSTNPAFVDWKYA